MPRRTTLSTTLLAELRAEGTPSNNHSTSTRKTSLDSTSTSGIPYTRVHASSRRRERTLVKRGEGELALPAKSSTFVGGEPQGGVTRKDETAADNSHAIDNVSSVQGSDSIMGTFNTLESPPGPTTTTVTTTTTTTTTSDDIEGTPFAVRRQAQEQFFEATTALLRANNEANALIDTFMSSTIENANYDAHKELVRTVLRKYNDQWLAKEELLGDLRRWFSQTVKKGGIGDFSYEEADLEADKDRELTEEGHADEYYTSQIDQVRHERELTTGKLQTLHHSVLGKIGEGVQDWRVQSEEAIAEAMKKATELTIPKYSRETELEEQVELLTRKIKNKDKQFTEESSKLHHTIQDLRLSAKQSQEHFDITVSSLEEKIEHLQSKLSAARAPLSKTTIKLSGEKERSEKLSQEVAELQVQLMNAKKLATMQQQKAQATIQGLMSELNQKDFQSQSDASQLQAEIRGDLQMTFDKKLDAVEQKHETALEELRRVHNKTMTDARENFTKQLAETVRKYEDILRASDKGEVAALLRNQNVDADKIRRDAIQEREAEMRILQQEKADLAKRYKADLTRALAKAKREKIEAVAAAVVACEGEQSKKYDAMVRDFEKQKSQLKHDHELALHAAQHEVAEGIKERDEEILTLVARIDEVEAQLQLKDGLYKEVLEARAEAESDAVKRADELQVSLQQQTQELQQYKDDVLALHAEMSKVSKENEKLTTDVKDLTAVVNATRGGKGTSGIGATLTKEALAGHTQAAAAALSGATTSAILATPTTTTLDAAATTTPVVDPLLSTAALVRDNPRLVKEDSMFLDPSVAISRDISLASILSTDSRSPGTKRRAKKTKGSRNNLARSASVRVGTSTSPVLARARSRTNLKKSHASSSALVDKKAGKKKGKGKLGRSSSKGAVPASNSSGAGMGTSKANLLGRVSRDTGDHVEISPRYNVIKESQDISRASTTDDSGTLKPSVTVTSLNETGAPNETDMAYKLARIEVRKLQGTVESLQKQVAAVKQEGYQEGKQAGIAEGVAMSGAPQGTAILEYQKLLEEKHDVEGQISSLELRILSLQRELEQSQAKASSFEALVCKYRQHLSHSRTLLQDLRQDTVNAMGAVRQQIDSMARGFSQAYLKVMTTSSHHDTIQLVTRYEERLTCLSQALGTNVDLGEARRLLSQSYSCGLPASWQRKSVDPLIHQHIQERRNTLHVADSSIPATLPILPGALSRTGGGDKGDSNAVHVIPALIAGDGQAVLSVPEFDALVHWWRQVFVSLQTNDILRFSVEDSNKAAGDSGDNTSAAATGQALQESSAQGQMLAAEILAMESDVKRRTPQALRDLQSRMLSHLSETITSLVSEKWQVLSGGLPLPKSMLHAGTMQVGTDDDDDDDDSLGPVSPRRESPRIAGGAPGLGRMASSLEASLSVPHTRSPLNPKHGSTHTAPTTTTTTSKTNGNRTFGPSDSKNLVDTDGADGPAGSTGDPGVQDGSDTTVAGDSSTAPLHAPQAPSSIHLAIRRASDRTIRMSRALPLGKEGTSSVDWSSVPALESITSTVSAWGDLYTLVACEHSSGSMESTSHHLKGVAHGNLPAVAMSAHAWARSHVPVVSSLTVLLRHGKSLATVLIDQLLTYRKDPFLLFPEFSATDAVRKQAQLADVQFDPPLQSRLDGLIADLEKLVVMLEYLAQLLVRHEKKAGDLKAVLARLVAVSLTYAQQDDLHGAKHTANSLYRECSQFDAGLTRLAKALHSKASDLSRIYLRTKTASPRTSIGKGNKGNPGVVDDGDSDLDLSSDSDDTLQAVSVTEESASTIEDTLMNVLAEMRDQVTSSLRSLVTSAAETLGLTHAETYVLALCKDLYRVTEERNQLEMVLVQTQHHLSSPRSTMLPQMNKFTERDNNLQRRLTLADAQSLQSQANIKGIESQIARIPDARNPMRQALERMHAAHTHAWNRWLLKRERLIQQRRRHAEAMAAMFETSAAQSGFDGDGDVDSDGASNTLPSTPSALTVTGLQTLSPVANAAAAAAPGGGGGRGGQHKGGVGPLVHPQTSLVAQSLLAQQSQPLPGPNSPPRTPSILSSQYSTHHSSTAAVPSPLAMSLATGSSPITTGDLPRARLGVRAFPAVKVGERNIHHTIHTQQRKLAGSGPVGGVGKAGGGQHRLQALSPVPSGSVARGPQSTASPLPSISPRQEPSFAGK